MNTFFARTGSNSTCFLAIKQSLPCGCVQFRGGVCRLRPPPPRSATASYVTYVTHLVLLVFDTTERNFIQRDTLRSSNPSVLFKYNKIDVSHTH